MNSLDFVEEELPRLKCGLYRLENIQFHQVRFSYGAHLIYGFQSHILGGEIVATYDFGGSWRHMALLSDLMNF